MLDPHCRREMLIRGGITTIMVAVAYLFLDAPPWVWLIPVAIIGLVYIKWAMRPRDPDEENDEA